MDEFGVVFGVLLVLAAVIVPPLLLISLFSRVKKLERTEVNVPEWLQRLYHLEKTVMDLEAKIAKLQLSVTRETAAPAAQEAPPKPPAVAKPPQVAAPSPAPASRLEPLPPHARPAISLGGTLPAPGKSAVEPEPADLETMIGGRWLNRIGILALLLAVSFFLKYAFDNNWIGPSGRVAIGILLGSALIPWSDWLLERGYKYFSEGIAALGQGVLFVSIWAGWSYYALYSQTAAFVGMVVVTGVMAAVAIGRDSERIAVLSLVGGFLTPVIANTGKNQEVILFSYLLLLGGAFLVIGAKRNWISLGPLSFGGTQILFWSWYGEFYAPPWLDITALFASLFFLLYFLAPVLGALRPRALHALEIRFVLLNSAAFLLALYLMLWPGHRWTMTVFVLVLSALHLAAARRFPPAAPGEQNTLQIVFAGLALTFVTLAIPIRLEGKWITLSFAVEGAVLVWSGFRVAVPRMRHAGSFLLCTAAARLFFVPIPATTQFLVNARFAAYATVVACIGAALYFARDRIEEFGDGEKSLFVIFGVAVNALALIALSLEFWDYFGKAGRGSFDDHLARHLSLSILWVVYAAGMILVGVRRQSAPLRWQALGLFGLVVVKVFLFDLSYLDKFYRILSFLILGIALLVVSFLYQRRTARERLGR